MTLRSCSPRLKKLSLFSPPAPCAKRMARGFRCLRAAIRAARPHLANIFEKLLDQKTFYFACGSVLATNPNHKKEDSRPFLRIGYLLLRMFVLHQKHREWTFRTISPTEAYFPGISPKISMAEKTFDTILFHSAKPLLTASHQSVLAFQFQPAVLDGSVP